MLTICLALLAISLILWVYTLILRRSETNINRQWKDNELLGGPNRFEHKGLRKVRISMTVLASLLSILALTVSLIGLITSKEEDKNGLLPIGSVVLLEDSTKKVMIIGYCQREVGTEGKLWDYSGCLFPEGYLSADKTYLFDEEQIKTVYSNGYEDEEQREYIDYVQEYLDENKNE